MRYLIDFKNSTTQDEIQLYLTTHNYTLVKIWDNYEKVVLVESNSFPVKTDLVDHIIQDESVEIKPVTVGTIINPPQSLWCLQDPSLPQIEIKTTDTKDWWKNYSLMEPEFTKDVTVIARKGSRNPVYIMDSGIKSDHPEFNGVSITNIFSVIPGNFDDTTGHGTAIASVISGNTCGITSSPLKIVKIFGAGHQTLQSEILSALDAIITDVPENTFAIVNCSWVIQRNPWVERKMLGMIENGIYVVAAAGNNGASIEDVTPAAMPEVITIGSYSSDLKPSDFSAYTGESHISYTNSSVNAGELDGWAPGENIWSARLSDDYGYAAGTSMSAAITSAVLSRYLGDLVDANGKRMPGWENYILIGDPTIDEKLLYWLCLRRENLLDLSDPKYSVSKSSIATMIDFSAAEVKAERFLTQRTYAIRAGEEKLGLKLFYPFETQQVEILEPFPENFFISPQGNLMARPDLSQGPSDGEPYRLYTSKIRITYLDGMIEDYTIDTYILSPLLDIGSLPDDHPVNILFQGTCQGAPQGCSVDTPVFCTNLCGFQCCNPAFGKSTRCFCA